MADPKDDTLFERFLAPVFSHLLLDQAALRRYRYSIDWDVESDRLRNPTLAYPDYYLNQHFHGIQQGYLNIDAPVTYDPITRYVLPPNETWVRQGLIDRIRCRPRRILDLGCGTGSATMLLKHAFPRAEVVGLDLSPYMLVAAVHKARTSGLEIQFCHGAAEDTGFPDASFDLVTASLLFHETPTAVTAAILREAVRLLSTGGELVILDGNQSTLQQTSWLTEVFEEPYIQDYAAGDLAEEMTQVGFGQVQRDDLWWMHQVVRGVKPINGRSPVRVTFEEAIATNGLAAHA